MSEQGVKVELITPAGMRRVLSFGPMFADTSTSYGEGPAVEAADDNTMTLRPAMPAERASAFVAACDEENFLQPFDWGEWSSHHEADLCSREFIRSADLVAIVKMLTTHIRADRFCDGHLLCVMDDGTIGAILDRLQSIDRER